MKADLYVQGHFWATIDVPGDSLLALLAKGMITETTHKCAQLKVDLAALDSIQCVISLSVKGTTIYPPGEPD